jgi:2,3-bisphosphoglycerate-dependent phosphoglycerate mutase
MKLYLFIFRHGETYFNQSRRFTGRINSRLTPQGRIHAKVVAKQLRNKLFTIAFHTSLTRTSESLRIVLKYHPECQEIRIDDRMIERSYGWLEGKYHKTIIQRYGKTQYDIWHRSYNTPPPNGESIQDVEKRVLSFISDLLTLMRRERVNVVICAHGNTIRLFRRYFEQLTIEQMMQEIIPYDEYYKYIIRA